MLTLRSHTWEEIEIALAGGQEVWALDTGNDGEDDTLIGSYAEVERDVLHYYTVLHDLSTEPEALPAHWTLERVSKE